MRLKTTGAVAAVFIGLVSVLAACSDPVEEAPNCAEHPKAKGCKKASPATPSSATPMADPAPLTTAPPPPGVRDAGTDAARPRKPDGGRPSLPAPEVACRDLLKCCARVQDTLERAACYGVGYNASQSTCANAIIAYQVFGGCNHDPLELPDIFNSDGTENTANRCTYLERQCNETYDCDGYYNECTGGTALPGDGQTSDDYCAGLPNEDDACGRNTYYCCEYGGDYFCGSDPSIDYTACDGYYP